MLPSYSFDPNLINYELPDQLIESAEALVSTFKTIFSEFVSMPQMLTLCKQFGVSDMEDLKFKLACQVRVTKATGMPEKAKKQ